MEMMCAEVIIDTPRPFLFFVAYLENIELKVIGRLVAGPENRMIGGLCPVLHLAEALVDA